MSGNTFGKILRLTTYGESHGPAIGGILDGCPAGLPLCENDLQVELDLRKPGSGAASTKRREADRVAILSGVFEGVTGGTPIAFQIVNEDQHSADYANIKDIFRPGHADWSYYHKYLGIRDYRGGGRASGRETACRVAGGAIAKKILAVSCGAYIEAACVELGGIAVAAEDVDMRGALKRPYFAASDYAPALWDAAVVDARKNGDTLGGIVRIVAHNVPAGLGEPVFDKLTATLAHALFSIGSVKGLEFGTGFAASRMCGSANNDSLCPADHCLPGARVKAAFTSNHAGGILGGISTGQDIIIQAAIKPIASIAMKQHTVNKSGFQQDIRIGGRHDLSAIPRAVPVLSAMTALSLADALLLQKRMDICV